jgi:hypothetical protein
LLTHGAFCHIIGWWLLKVKPEKKEIGKSMKITLIMAMTADGKIARHNTHYPDWTGKADKKMFRQLTTAAGVVIMGSRTYGTIGKPLPQRLNWVMTRSPQRFASSEQLVFSDDSPTVIVDKLVARGYSAAALTGGPPSIHCSPRPGSSMTWYSL